MKNMRNRASLFVLLLKMSGIESVCMYVTCTLCKKVHADIFKMHVCEEVGRDWL